MMSDLVASSALGPTLLRSGPLHNHLYLTIFCQYNSPPQCCPLLPKFLHNQISHYPLLKTPTPGIQQITLTQPPFTSPYIANITLPNNAPLSYPKFSITRSRIALDFDLTLTSKPRYKKGNLSALLFSLQANS